MPQTDTTNMDGIDTKAIHGHGGRQKGHLRLMMQDAFYSTHDGHHFIIPNDPDP